MVSEFDVLHTAGLDLSFEEFNSIKANHPRVGEQMILDLVNGVSCVAKDLNDKSKKRNSGYFSSMIDLFSGQSSKRSTQINELLINGMAGAVEWLKSNTGQISRINYRFADLASEMLAMNDEMKSAVQGFYDQYKKTRDDVDILKLFKESTEETIASMNQRIENLEAQNHVDREVAKFSSLHYPVFLRIFTILDNLSSGEAGAFYYYNRNNDKGQQLLSYIKDRLLGCFDQSERAEFIVAEKALGGFKLNSTDRDILNFLSHKYIDYTGNNNLLHDIPTLVNSVVRNDKTHHTHVRTFLTIEEFVNDSVLQLMTV